MTKWKTIKTPPNSDRLVLGWDGEYHVMTKYNKDESCFISFDSYYEEWANNSSILHWMPLPRAPRKSRANKT